jgi:hypothetical protein
MIITKDEGEITLNGNMNGKVFCCGFDSYITLDPKRTYIIHEGKVREVPASLVTDGIITAKLILNVLPEVTQ